MIIQSKRVYIADTLIPAQLQIEGDKIVAVYRYNEKPVDKDYGDRRILPGFYDLHTHGYMGYDTTDGGKDGLRRWVRDLPKEGVCGFLPTTLTMSKDVLLNSVREVREVQQENPEGAAILGIHLEGPYINAKYKGAQPEPYIVKPDIEEFEEYQKACDNIIKVVTMAPEKDEDFAFIKHVSQTGVNVQLGHSDADYDTAIMAIANGVNGFTHTYNAMPGLGHRENGSVGAAFRATDTFAEIICDGNHSTPAALNIFFKQKPTRGIMISDALMCKGYEPGAKFDFGGQMVEIYPDGSAHLCEGKKNLAGSTLKLNEGLKVLVEKALVPFEVAVDAASLNPMLYLHMADHKGRLRAGYDADIVVLNDDYSVEATYCLGKEYH
ncbi:MAG: N-acetylglucosamine-6-phosphate deacetylase [Erysipelotrichaceae bacterium]|nr:N-acetylglucosamine-6-phosphate deacetylase [Erysipelotrichaceae bacterium]